MNSKASTTSDKMVFFKITFISVRIRFPYIAFAMPINSNKHLINKSKRWFLTLFYGEKSYGTGSNKNYIF